MSDIAESEYSLHEEMIHASLTHAFGLILSIVGLVILMIWRAAAAVFSPLHRARCMEQR